MKIINSVWAIFVREYLITIRNFYDVMTIIIFFILGILIFVFSIGPNKEIYSQIGVGIIWTLLLLSTNLSIKKLFQDDFNDGNLILLYISGLSFELVVIIKMITNWLFFQLPFFIVIPIACLILNVDIDKILLLITNYFLLTNQKNLLDCLFQKKLLLFYF